MYPKCDSDEIVNFPVGGPVTLHTAVKRYRAMTPDHRQLVTVFRERGCEPPILNRDNFEELIKRPEFGD
jgi:hypothetical protein